MKHLNPPLPVMQARGYRVHGTAIWFCIAKMHSMRIMLLLKRGSLAFVDYKENLIVKNSLFRQNRQLIGLILSRASNTTFIDNSAAIGEKTGTIKWDKPSTPPPTITLSTLRTSAAIFRRVGICA